MKQNKIKMIVLDVDGTLTDGGVYYTEERIEIKKFNVKDGMAIANLNKAGIHFAIITGRSSDIVAKRATELGITEIYQGVGDKIKIMKNLAEKYEIAPENMAYIGDDWNDIRPMKFVGLPMTVKNGAEQVKEICSYIAKYNGGDGAVRDCLEFIMKRDNIFEQIMEKYN